jgi:membrane protein
MVDERGRDADAPHEIPARGWKDIAIRVKDEARDDDVSLLGAGVAFFAVLSLAPALAAFVSIYGLVVSPDDIVNQVEDLSSTMPTEAKDLLIEQLEQVARSNGAGLGLGAAVGLALALWSASAAVKHLISAVGLAYDEQNERGFVRTRLLAIGLTLAGIAFMTVAVFLLTGLPAVADDLAGGVGRTLAAWGRWPLLAGLMLLALAIVYRVAPDRDDPRWRWVTWGAGVATVAWLVACAAFSLYASRFGSYNETYGAMASVVVLMLWLYLTAVCVILGAEINAEMEHQTARDSTVGPPKPLGARSAHMADTVGRPADADASTGVPEHAPG